MALNDISDLEERLDSENTVFLNEESNSFDEIVLTLTRESGDKSDLPLQLIDLTNELRPNDMDIPLAPVNFLNSTSPNLAFTERLTTPTVGVSSSLQTSVTVTLKRKNDPPEVLDCTGPKVPNLSTDLEGNRELTNFESGALCHKDCTAFYQVLDIFPDIDKTFLRNECRKGLDTNSLTNLILEMNNEHPRDPEMQDAALAFDLAFTRHQVFRNDDEEYAAAVRPTSRLDNLDLVIDQVARNSIARVEEPSAFQDSETRSAVIKKKAPSTATSTVVRPTDEDEDRDVVIMDQVPSSIASTTVDSVNLNVEPEPTKDTKPPVDVKAERLAFLSSIFPDADDAFLEEKSQLGEDEVRTFVADTLESRDYPKRKLVMNDEKSSEDDIGLYTTSFSVTNFLQVFPDPFTYFLDETRVCQPSIHGTEFLKRRYRKHLVKTIEQTYKNFKYNLALTCHHFDTTKQKLDLRSMPRSLQEIRMPTTKNTPFIKEVCFIEHKQEIQTYIDAQKEAKAVAYQQAKDKGELIDCNCCYDQVLFEECATCNEGDLFCRTCVVKSVEVRIGDGHITFPCLLDCGSEFSLQLLQGLLEARMFSKLLVRIQMSEVKAANIDGLEDCPFCQFATIPPPDTKIFTCLNPECLKESCRNCHKISHIPLRCEEVENDDQARARKYIEDEMTKALVRECYKCKKSFIKMDGCNKMTCSCGARMCYVCRQPVKDYKHFNGQGGSETHKCPLYSTEEALHVEAVKEVAEKALQAVKETNPDLELKHDPTKLLPEAPKNERPLPGMLHLLPLPGNIQFNQELRQLEHDVMGVLNAQEERLLQRLERHPHRQHRHRDEPPGPAPPHQRLPPLPVHRAAHLPPRPGAPQPQHLPPQRFAAQPPRFEQRPEARLEIGAIRVARAPAHPLRAPAHPPRAAADHLQDAAQQMRATANRLADLVERRPRPARMARNQVDPLRVVADRIRFAADRIGVGRQQRAQGWVFMARNGQHIRLETPAPVININVQQNMMQQLPRLQPPAPYQGPFQPDRFPDPLPAPNNTVRAPDAIPVQTPRANQADPLEEE